MSELPSSAKIVIVGGGIVGCSVAYHLGKMGLTDVLLVERGKLTCGSTWHAAGLVGQLRTSANITQLLGYSVELYDRLEQETGLATGWKRNGGLRLACNPERWTEVKRQATTATSFGLEMHLLTPKEAQALWPLMQVEDVVGAAFLPTDGQASPSDIAMSLAKGARNAGVKIAEEVAVTGIEVEDGRVRAVVTDKGRITCDKLVICAGQWSRELGRIAGVNIPLVPVQHQYLITEAIEGVTRDLPTLRDPDRLTYWKEEVGGLVMGGYEPNPKPWAVDGLPERFEFQLLDDDLEHFEPLLELAIGRVPAMQSAGIKEFINGPESFTPDGNFILGEAPEVRGIFVGAGFNAFGIAAGRRRRHGACRMGGKGRAAVRPLAGRHPPLRQEPFRYRLGAHAHARGLRQALHDGMAVRRISLGPPAPPLASLRQAESARRLLSARSLAGSGRTGLPTSPVGRSRGPLQLRTAELVRRRRPRAQGSPRARRSVRPDLVRQVHAGGQGRRGGAVVDLCQRRRQAAWVTSSIPRC